MIRSFSPTAAFALLVLLSHPASAAVRCDQPYAPEIQVSGKITKAQIFTMHDDAQTFIAASDIYQACLLKASQTNSTFQQEATSKINANQREKERIGKAFKAALDAYSQTQRSTAENSELVLR